MRAIKILTRTARTVTLSRRDYDALLAAANPPPARPRRFSRSETKRLLAGESPVRIWREKRGMTQRALADATEIGPSYLAEIEGGKKPGSAAALRRIAQILNVPMEQLVEPAKRKKRKA